MNDNKEFNKLLENIDNIPMLDDEDLKSRVDYSEGQKKAAHRVLVELVNLFGEYRDDIRIAGGWVLDLMFLNLEKNHYLGKKMLQLIIDRKNQK